MDQGSVFTITNPKMDTFLKSSVELIEKLKATPDCQAVLVLSCIVRRMSFGTKPTVEAALVKDELHDFPFMFAYAGGEICPTSVRDGKAVNRFHNFSITACIL
jgi:hypothetical protein